ncbi:MAG: DUF4116 domain-containing protein [Clostridia bacterium]|nr:DUF4116 domain-containing protein [Clostridia bacterium]
MEKTEKYIDCKKEDVIRRVPDCLWCDWLERAPEEDRADETFMKKIVLLRGECLKFAPDSLRSDRNVILKVVKNCPSAFVYASGELQNDRKFVKQAVNQNAEVIKYVSDHLKNDKGIALLAVRKDGGNLAFLSEKMQNDADVIEASLGGNLYNLRYAPEKVRDNKEIAVRALSKHGQLLEFVSERLRADGDAVTAAVGSSWNALGFASEDLRDDRDTVLAAERHNGYALQFASDRLKDDKEIVLTAIETYEGNVLCYASERLRDDKETVLAAVRRSEYPIGSASVRLRHDPDVIRAVLDAFPGQFENLPEDVQEDLDVILFGLESVVKHLPDPDNYSFFEDSTSEYYADYDQAAVDFLDILESIPREVLREDSELNDRVCRLAVEMDNAYYEGEYPYQDVSCRIVSMVGDLYEEKDIPLRPVLKEKLYALRKKESEKKKQSTCISISGTDFFIKTSICMKGLSAGRSRRKTERSGKESICSRTADLLKTVCCHSSRISFTLSRDFTTTANSGKTTFTRSISIRRMKRSARGCHRK